MMISNYMIIAKTRFIRTRIKIIQNAIEVWSAIPKTNELSN